MYTNTHDLEVPFLGVYPKETPAQVPKETGQGIHESNSLNLETDE